MFMSKAKSSQFIAATNYASGKSAKSYSLAAGKKSTSKYYSSCSQLVWQSLWKQGYDLDSNGGIIVTPAQLEKDSQTIVY